MNFYFIHAKWVTDRQRVIDDFIKTIQKYTFRSITPGKIVVVDEMDPNDINGDFIKQHVNYTQLTEPPSLLVYNGLIKNLHVHQLSNALKHYTALEKIVKSEGNDEDLNIILEDDILYEGRMCLLLEKLIRTLPTDFDMMFLGLPTNKEVKNPHEISFQNTVEVFKILPYCDSYVVSKSAAKKLYDNFLPIKFLTNIQLSFVVEKLGLKTQLCFPNLFMDGTKVGSFVSNLNPNNAIMFNSDYNIVKSVVNKMEKKEVVSSEEETNIERIFSTSPISQHPDLCYQKAKYLANKNQYALAKECYEETYQKYKTHNTIINHESIFLKDYIRIHKHLQS